MKTQVIIDRDYKPLQTLGHLTVVQIDENLNRTRIFDCKTIEKPWKENARNISCIEPGTYKCKKTYSPRFKKVLIEVLDVEGRSGIRFHIANYSKQVEGCIAPGLVHIDLDGDGLKDVSYSAVACGILHDVTPEEFDLIIM